MTAIAATHQKLQSVMRQGFMSFIEAAKPRRKPDLWLTPPAPASVVTPEAAILPQLDPVALTVLAVNRLGLATFRTATSGKAATVSVPDARTAEIFRAALDEMQKNRRTDRLVDVVVSAEDGSVAKPDDRGRDAAKA
jgi:hypothetical protein